MQVFVFGDFRLDAESRRLTRLGVEHAIEPRVFDVVAYLIAQRSRAVGRDELISAVWGRIEGADATLAQAVLKARRTFADDGRSQRVIRSVPRFGYQWVAPTHVGHADAQPVHAAVHEPAADVAGTAIESRAFESAPASSDPVSLPTLGSARDRRVRKLAWTAMAAAVALAIGALVLRAPRNARDGDPASAATSPVPGLVLVKPASVRSAVAEDGWMRLGVMALTRDALRSLPHHAVVADDTALAAAGASPSEDDMQLRRATRADIVVSTSASRSKDHWVMEALIESADGKRETVASESDDPVAAAASLATRVREVLAPDVAHRETPSDPAVLALASRVRAATLEGHNARALELIDSAPQAERLAPDVVVLRAKALNRLGRPDEAARALEPLLQVDPATLLPSARVAEAWTTLAYSDLIRGSTVPAQHHFHDAIDAAAASGDRVERARAWRGLGNAEAASGDFAEAEASYLRAQFDLRDGSDPLLGAHLMDDLGTVAMRRGRLVEAIDAYGKAATSAAALGATDIELGSRMNLALAETARLRHHVALALWRDVLARLHDVDYPAMQRFARIQHALALAETGDSGAAVDDLPADTANAAHGDALEDARIDEVRALWSAGATAAALSRAHAVLAAATTMTDEQRVQLNALLVRLYLAARDERSAQALVDDAAAWPLADCTAATRSSAELAQALWQSQRGDTASAADHFGRALLVAREQSAPLELRDVVVPYADFLLARNRLDDAQRAAGFVGGFADDDFALSLLLARLDVAAGNTAHAATLFTRAHRLAGQRWTDDLDAEERRSVSKMAMNDDGGHGSR